MSGDDLVRTKTHHMVGMGHMAEFYVFVSIMFKKWIN